MTALYHLSLEKEIVVELNPDGLTADSGLPPKMRRETVLAVVARSAQQSQPFHELLNEASLLGASALDMEYFAYAEVRDTRSLHVGWGKVADSTRNVDPVPHEVTSDAACSGFAFALKCDHPVVVFNAGMEDRFQDQQMIEHRIRSGVICPIGFRGERFGGLGVFSTQPRTLTKSDALFLQSIAILLGPTRAHQKAERELAEHSRFLSTAIDSLEAMVVMLRADGTISQLNRACINVSGFAADELRGRRLIGTFFTPAEGKLLVAGLSTLRNNTIPYRCETSITTKQGERRQISWTFTRLANGNPEAVFLATGIDVTEQHRALSQLKAQDSFAARQTPADAADQTATSTIRRTPAAASAGVPAGADRRVHDRRPYSCIQSIAPCIDGKLPDRNQFRAVRCHDISPRGFSFLLAAEPHFDELVAAFGSAQSRLFLRSRIVHTTQFRYEGRNVLLVGCEYTGRVRLPWVGNFADDLTLAAGR